MSTNRKTTVGVIFGGRSVEHDVSVVTGHQVIRAFNRERFDIVPIYIDRQGNWFTGEPLLEIDNFKQDVTTLKGVEPCLLSPNVRHHGLIVNPLAGRFARSSIIRLDVVFPALHGTHGEDGTIQGLCELADIPYVGCATLASALTNDKLMTKQVLRQSR
ncbi:MAG: D-alanine--D-alanine ligase, partial [Chloroflexi bacterium]